MIYIFPLLLFLLNFVSKALFLTDRDIGLDEPFTIYHAQFGFAEIIEQLEACNNPPLFELLLHCWIKLFGISPCSVRCLPLLFASLAPLALYYFAKRFFSLKIGILGSLFLSLSSLLLVYAHDCRVYALFVLLTILSMYFYLALLNSTVRKMPAAIAYVVIGTLLIYAHYFGFFVLFIQVIHLLLHYRKSLLRFLVYFTCIIILYLPHLYPMLVRMQDSVQHGTWVNPPQGIDSLYNMLWAFNNFPFITVFAILLMAAALFLMARRPGIYKPENTLVILWFLVPYLGMFFISYKVPMYLSRYLVYALPGYYLVLALSTGFVLKNAGYNRIVVIAMLLSFACTLELNPDRQQYTSERVNFIKRFKDPATLVIVSDHNFATTFAYYYNREIFTRVEDGIEYRQLDSLLQNDNVYFMTEPFELQQVNLNRYNRIIYYGAGGRAADPANPLLEALNDNHSRYYNEHYNNGHLLSVYLKR